MSYRPEKMHHHCFGLWNVFVTSCGEAFFLAIGVWLVLHPPSGTWTGHTTPFLAAILLVAVMAGCLAWHVVELMCAAWHGIASYARMTSVRVYVARCLHLAQRMPSVQPDLALVPVHPGGSCSRI